MLPGRMGVLEARRGKSLLTTDEHRDVRDAASARRAKAVPQGGLAATRRRVYQIIEVGRGEDAASKTFDVFIVTLIVLNVAAFVAETVPSLHQSYAEAFHWFEVFSVLVFTLEYLARLWVAVEVPFLARVTPLSARLKMARRPALIIDLLAILPFYVGHIFALDLRVLRILRLLRFLKLSRYSPALHTLVRVIANERRALAGALLLLVAAVLFAATGMHYLEQHAQPDKFGSVPDAAWWAVATLTTVGYGDVTPVTALGRFFGGIVMVAGLCILALPVAIISTGFAQEVGRRDFVVNWSLMSRIPMLAELDASSVAELMPLLHAHNLPPNVEVMAEGSAGDAIYFLASGHVRRERRGGAHLPRPAMSSAAPARWTAGCMARLCHGRTLPPAQAVPEDFHRLETATPEIARRIRATVARHHVLEAKQKPETAASRMRDLEAGLSPDVRRSNARADGDGDHVVLVRVFAWPRRHGSARRQPPPPRRWHRRRRAARSRCSSVCRPSLAMIT